MNAIRFAAALASICTSPLFAATPSGSAIPDSAAKAPLKAYVIQPPDVIEIEMPTIVPKPSYRADIFDVLQIRANALPDQPIDNFFMVEAADGTINLGPTYGAVGVYGMTVDEIRATLNKSLHQWLKDSSLTVRLARVSGKRPISGHYLVGPDGTINLRDYGLVHIAGKTVTEARIAIQTHLKQFLDSPELSVDVAGYNSKVYYVIMQGAGLSDSVQRMSITGNETVLDAVSTVNGQSQVKKVRIARPNAHKDGGLQIMPVDWDAITQGAQTATNYEILPGDRVFIEAKEPTAAADGKPLPEQTLGRNYCRSRNGF